MPESSVREFVEDATDPAVRGFLHSPKSPSNDGLILAHSAGSNSQAPLLIALAEAFSNAGFHVLRCDLPYRQTRPYGPPGPGDAARDRAGLKNAIAALRKSLGAPLLAAAARSGTTTEHDTNGVRIFLGGHSYGGRQASMLCAEQPDLAAGLLLLSYPLHPPRRPEQLRTQHLTDLRTPTLFVHGTRDPFGSISEIEQAIKLVNAGTKLVAIDGAGHDLGFKGKGKKQELPEKVLEEFRSFFAD